jgi:Flp pilus assembly protein TadG
MKKPVCPGATQGGAAAVEFALLLPVLLLLVFGVIETSIALYNKTVITQASREAARVGIVLASPRASDADLRQRVIEHAQPVLLQLGTAGQLTTTVDRSNPVQLKVVVDYSYTGLLLGTLMGRTDNGWLLSASTVMVYE